MYFQVSKPLPKNKFLEVYKEAVFLTQILFAPFGFSSSTAPVLGDDIALELYTNMFQQFEEFVSKRLFVARGFSDGQIVASMHEYIGEYPDQEVSGKHDV
jgi:hypothetical protein